MSKQEQSTIILLENMQKSLDEKDKIIEKQAAQIKLQNQKIDYLTRQLFSKKSEKLPDGQLSLFADLEHKEIEEERATCKFDHPKPTNFSPQ